ncbi:MAG TPA: glucose-1-phosphate thymidylyltransferase [Symbiobacteriaceae bacterium]|nr:glucose-1-phosphate thymidylyltransferase [Symbiobacteriaceae bacterium]
MKALVLCAGRGTRLRPLTHTRAKAALPVAGRPVLAHILSYLLRFGFTDVGVVISPDQEELRDLPAAVAGQRVEFVVQRTPLGIAHAVQTASPYLGREPFLLYLGDNLTNEDLLPTMQRFWATGADGVVAVRTVANPRAFGIAELDGDRLVAVEEKPPAPKSDLAIAGIYLFRPSVHEAIRELAPSARGEYEITDAISALIRKGRKVLAHRMSGWWQDMGTPEGMLAANALLLDTISTDVAPGVSLQSASVQGRVVIGPGVTLVNVRLRGPLLIGPGSYLEDAYIGPYTSVGEGARIRGAGLENSILLPGCRLEAPAFHLEDCLLGRGTVVEVKDGRAITLLLGDDGRLQIPYGRRS